jgi:hypothetical protein
MMACTSATSEADRELLEAYQREVAAANARAQEAARTPEGEHGGQPRSLVISTTDISTDGRHAKIRGQVENPFSERVDGLRYVVVLVAGDDANLRELESIRRESDITLEPGQRRMMRLDVESMYFAGGGRVLIGAFPKKLGGRDVPPPEGWRGGD